MSFSTRPGWGLGWEPSGDMTTDFSLMGLMQQ
jgi:hypothetical protein